MIFSLSSSVSFPIFCILFWISWRIFGRALYVGRYVGSIVILSGFMFSFWSVCFAFFVVFVVAFISWLCCSSARIMASAPWASVCSSRFGFSRAVDGTLIVIMFVGVFSLAVPTLSRAV